MIDETHSSTKVETEIAVFQLEIVTLLINIESLVSDIETELRTSGKINTCHIAETELVAHVDRDIDALLRHFLAIELSIALILQGCNLEANRQHGDANL